MRVVYMGTPAFAVPSLQALLDAGHTVAGVYTQPDRPSGRGHKLTAPPVKQLALEAGLPVYQPDRLRDDGVIDGLRALSPDVIVVAAYGRILPPAVLAIPPLGCVNVHASLLPRLRGAAPIQWAVLRGDTEAGVTTMCMAEGLDTGDILLSRATPIGPEEDAASLYDRLSVLGAELLIPTLQGLEAGTLTPVPQDDALATYAPMLDKSLCPLDWNRPAAVLHDQVRGLQPWPVATTLWQGKTLKVHAARVSDRAARPGQVTVENGRLFVGCGDGRSLELCEVQLEGGRRMAAAELLRGHPVADGSMLV